MSAASPRTGSEPRDTTGPAAEARADDLPNSAAVNPDSAAAAPENREWFTEDAKPAAAEAEVWPGGALSVVRSGAAAVREAWT